MVFYNSCTLLTTNPAALGNNFREDMLHFTKNGSITFAEQLVNARKKINMVLNQKITKIVALGMYLVKPRTS